LPVPSLADENLAERGLTAPASGLARLPVIVICSARPRVGRTLLARLLTEYLLADGREAVAFDANPVDRALSDYLPGHTLTAEIGDTRGQMALFDRLVANDGVGKVIDLAPDLTAPFFELSGKLGFTATARSAGIDPLALFVVEGHSRSKELGYMLMNGLAGMPVIPVHNEAVALPQEADLQQPSLSLPALSPLLRGVISRRGFLFSRYATDPENARTALAAWVKRAFLSFRALELRQVLAAVERSYGASADQTISR
jgi:hypothetical protein